VILAVIVGGGILGYLRYFNKEIVLLTKFPEIKKPEKIETEKPKIEEKTTNWRTYLNSVYNVELKYPNNWQLKEEVAYAHKYEGNDGFFQISAVSGTGLTMDEVCKNEAHHKLKPYGSQPKIEKLRIQNKEACLILPSDDHPEVMKNQAALIVQYPQPIQISGESYNYFILWADRDHLNEIAKTFRFIVDETADWKTYRNEEYGFEIKYPEGWEIKIWESGEIRIKNLSSYSFLEIEERKNEENLSLDKWFKKNNPTLISLAKPETINGVKAYRLNSVGLQLPNSLFIVTIADNEKRIFRIFAYSGQENDNNILNQMLFTFRFIE